MLLATAAVAVVVAALLAGVTLHQSRSAAPTVEAGEAPRPEPGADPVRGFLKDYVDPDGRVVRRDQGGDTVSEGQAYAMLLAVAADDEATFDKVWSWTRTNLTRSDGLLSWKYDGQIVDANSAADADLDAAHALVAAAATFDKPVLRSEGIRLGKAILDHETKQTPLGRMLLGGSWATTAPYSVNPSYLSPVAVEVLSTASGDPRWDELTAGYGKLLAGKGTALPSDWVQITPEAKVAPMPPPDNGPVGFGLDAARVPVRAAISCLASDRTEAARLAPVLAKSNGEVRGGYDLGGGKTVDWQHPLAFVAAAAAADAAGDDQAAGRLTEAATELNQRTPTYYGAAWTALGSIWLDGRPDPISPCPEGATQ
ncbi:glycosyl hydrolase family 8 [Kribbella sp. NPDC056861]|uniref:glycosyl hydrolase family 8 n=1 Tax=Kribbella sp. NPDC056861 TaxID=3154857 RepID=UPI00342BC413